MNESRVDLKAKKMCQFKGIPPYYIPKWRYMCLNNKLPMLKNVPEGAVNLYIGDGSIGSFPYIKNKNLDFDLWDPKMQKLPCDLEYDSLRDPYLKCYFSNSDRLKTLYKQGLLTREGKTITDLRNYNKYRKYLHDVNLEIMKTIQRQTECDNIKKVVINTAIKKKEEEHRARGDPCAAVPLTKRHSDFLRQELKGLCDRAVYEFKKTSYFSHFPEGEQDCLVKFKEILLKDIKKKALFRLRKLQDYEDNQNSYWCEWLKHTKAELQDRADELVKGKAYNFERCRHIKEYEELIAYKRSNERDFVQAARKVHKRKQLKRLQAVRQHVCKVTHRQYPLSAVCPYEFFEKGTWETACPYQEVVNGLRDKLYCEDEEYVDKGEMLAIEGVQEEEEEEEEKAAKKSTKKIKKKEKGRECRGTLVDKKVDSTSVADLIVKGVLKNALALTVKHLRLPFVCHPNTKSKIRNIRNTYFLQEMMGGVKDELARLVKNNLENLRKVVKSNKRNKKVINENNQIPVTVEQADLWRSAPLMRCGSSTMIGRYVREQLLQIATKLKQEGKKGARFEAGKYDEKFENALAEVTIAKDVYDMSCQLIDGKLMVCQCLEIINIFNEDDVGEELSKENETDQTLLFLEKEDDEAEEEVKKEKEENEEGEEEELNETEKELKRIEKQQKKESALEDVICCREAEEEEEDEEENTFEIGDISVKNETKSGKQSKELKKCVNDQKDDLVYNLISSLITNALIILRDSIACRAIDTEDIFNLCALINRKMALGESKMMCKEVQKLIEEYSNQLVKNRCMNLLVKETVKKIKCTKDSAKADEELSKSILCATKKFVSKILENLISEIKFSQKTEEDEDDVFKDEVCSDKTESVCTEDYGGAGDDPQSNQQADEIASMLSKVVPHEDSFTASGVPDEPDSTSNLLLPLPSKTAQTPSDQQLNYHSRDSISKLETEKKSPNQRVSPNSRDMEPIKAPSFEKENVRVSPDSPNLSIKKSLTSESINTKISPSSLDFFENFETVDSVNKIISPISKAKTPSDIQNEKTSSDSPGSNLGELDGEEANYRVSPSSKATTPSDLQNIATTPDAPTSSLDNEKVSLPKTPNDASDDRTSPNSPDSKLDDKYQKEPNYGVSPSSRAKTLSDLQDGATSPDAPDSKKETSDDANKRFSANSYELKSDEKYQEEPNSRTSPSSRAKTLSDLQDGATSPNSPALNLDEKYQEEVNYRISPSSRAKTPSDLQDRKMSPDIPDSKKVKSYNDSLNERLSPNSPDSKLADEYQEEPNYGASPSSRAKTLSDLQDGATSPDALDSNKATSDGDDVNERLSPNSPASKVEEGEVDNTNLRVTPSSKAKTPNSSDSKKKTSYGDDANKRFSPNSPASKLDESEVDNTNVRATPSSKAKTLSDLHSFVITPDQPHEKSMSGDDSINNNASPSSIARLSNKQNVDELNQRFTPNTPADLSSDQKKEFQQHIPEVVRSTPNSPDSDVQNLMSTPNTPAEMLSDTNTEKLFQSSPAPKNSAIAATDNAEESQNKSKNNRITPDIQDRTLSDLHDLVYSPSSPAPTLKDIDEETFLSNVEKNEIETNDFVSYSDKAQKTSNRLSPNTIDKTLSDIHDMKFSPSSFDKVPSEKKEQSFVSEENTAEQNQNESSNNRMSPDLQDKTLSDIHNLIYSPSSVAKSLSDLKERGLSNSIQDNNFLSTSENLPSNLDKSSNDPAQPLSDLNNEILSTSSPMPIETIKNLENNESQNESNNNRFSLDLQDRTLSDLHDLVYSPSSPAPTLKDIDEETFFINVEKNEIETNDFVSYSDKAQKTSNRLSPNTIDKTLSDIHDMKFSPSSFDKVPSEKKEQSFVSEENTAEQNQNESSNNRMSPDLQDKTLSDIHNLIYSPSSVAKSLSDLKERGFSNSIQDNNFLSTPENLPKILEKSLDDPQDTSFSLNNLAQPSSDLNNEILSPSSPASNDPIKTLKNTTKQSQNESNNNQTFPDSQDRTLSGIYNLRYSPSSAAKSLSDSKKEVSTDPTPQEREVDTGKDSQTEKNTSNDSQAPDVCNKLDGGQKNE